MPMNKQFSDQAWQELVEWVHEDRKTVDKIYDLLRDIERNGASKGMGKPEYLKHLRAWSRRIDQKNRLLYEVDGDNLMIHSCKGHYGDK